MALTSALVFLLSECGAVLGDPCTGGRIPAFYALAISGGIAARSSGAGDEEGARNGHFGGDCQGKGSTERDLHGELLTLLVGTFITLLMTLHVAGRASQPPPPNKWLSTHFTIPILSPFASVVEHEASIVGTKVLSVCVLVFGAVAYATVRFWLSRPR
ncbi:hypothetical protein HDZ31DRAFT_71708 [Schizophyllum fasciatum]